MPQREPLIGELWHTHDSMGREQRGIIADVDNTSTTIVSFTGNRVRQANNTFHMMWNFAQAAPRTGLTCGRRGCPEAAVFKWRRDGIDEYICPRHVPRGIQLEYLTDTPVGVQSRTTQGEVTCPSCASPDPTEDLTLPRPERAPWSWWNCNLCGRFWVTIAGPPGTLTGAALRGAWYHAQIISGLEVIAGIGSVDRIEAGRAALGDLRSIAPVNLQQFDPQDARLVMELEPTVIHVVLRQRPVVQPRARSAMGVQRLGGRPDRPAAETGTVLSRPTRLSPAVTGAIPAEPPPPLPPTPPVSPLPTPPVVFPPNPPALQADLDFLADACRVTIGERWRQVGSDGVVVIVEDRGTEVMYRPLDAPFPVSMARANFLTLYAPLRSSPMESPYAEVLPGQEWRTSAGEDVVVEALHEKRHTVTVKLKDGRTATYAHRDFDGMQRVTRRSAYAHLADTLRESKE